MGDSADNYPGVKGIGEKTALKLLKDYDSIDQIVEKIDHLPKGIKTKIEQNLDLMYLSKNLAEIKCDLPISCSLDDALWHYDQNKAETKLIELEIRNPARFFS